MFEKEKYLAKISFLCFFANFLVSTIVIFFLNNSLSFNEKVAIFMLSFMPLISLNPRNFGIFIDKHIVKFIQERGIAEIKHNVRFFLCIAVAASTFGAVSSIINWYINIG